MPITKVIILDAADGPLTAEGRKGAIHVCLRVFLDGRNQVKIIWATRTIPRQVV